MIRAVPTTTAAATAAPATPTAPKSRMPAPETGPESSNGNGDDNYLFLVVDKANGAIVAMDKTFLEAE